MADALNYLSLISALNYSNNVQGLYSNYNPYSAANLYGGSDEDSTSFSDIFGSCINALQSSNTSLLSELSSSINSNVSEADARQFIENLEEASQDTCDCKSADLVKELYSAYLSDTTGYAKNRLNQLITAIGSGTTSETAVQSQTVSQQTINTGNTTEIDLSIPSEEEIDSMIAASITLPA